MNHHLYYNIVRPLFALSYKVLFLGLILISSVNCGLGTATPGGNDIGIEIVQGDVEVDPIFVRTGVSSSTVETDDILATVYVGRRFYQEIDSEFNINFNPSRNFLTQGDSSENYDEDY